MKIVRIEKDEFELEDGSVYPICPPFGRRLSLKEFQVHYDRARNIIQSLKDAGSDNKNSSTVGRRRKA